MTIDLEQYQEMKDKIDKLQRDKDRAEGALSEMMKELNDKYECTTIEEAEQLALQLKREARQLEKDYEEAMEQFQAKWKGVL